MSQAQIFVSYRRDDSAGFARAIYDLLVGQFSDERVFFDVDDIEPGIDFDEAIHRALSQSEVLLVMIGQRWLAARETGGRRIDDPLDYVHREIAAALAQDIRVIPVLLDGAAMPSEDVLPEPLRGLARRNAVEVRNSRFESDTGRLIATLREVLREPEVQIAAGGGPTSGSGSGAGSIAGASASAGRARRMRWPLWAAAAALLVALGYFGLLRPPPRPDVNGEWLAEVTYDWPNARYDERFRFGGEAGELHGTASFLGSSRGILEGSVDKDGLRFVTRTQEVLGASENPKEVVHRYRGRLTGGEIRFVMQSEGGYSEHVPVEFVARKAGSATAKRTP